MSAESSTAINTAANTGVNGKATQQPHGLVEVQPPRLSDLQPRYASTIQHDDSNPEAHGWYASFSMSSPQKGLNFERANQAIPIEHSIGECIGGLGVIPCCPCPNPFRPVQQGEVGLVTRFGRFVHSSDLRK
jgi:hypothetical protein